ncbi:hypothetical protein Nepgr_018892 [Nepenthes gracilis]|uniref:Uncharacterized protein n=1 Tax=Nepenthes gracilis TaxID=150966 RepID=A0AAD3SUB3_NEPGR|nr:hypothetical protein Nepgr_018892 [Nepenthes gracilis]
MAHHLWAHTWTSMPRAGLGALGLVFCAFALLLCASHSRKLGRWRARFRFGRNKSNPDSIIHMGGEGQQVSLWQKSIMMGKKCQLPDFSGLIIHDSAGNIIPSPKPPQLALPWKEQCKQQTP